VIISSIFTAIDQLLKKGTLLHIKNGLDAHRRGYRMRTSLIAAFAAVVLLAGGATSAQAAKALAMSQGGGFGWAGGETQEQARVNAILQCEISNGRDNCMRSAAEENDWYFAGVTCAGDSHIAASPQGPERAESLAYRKAELAGDYDCFTNVIRY
jgi:hypothetical protein